MHSGTQELPGAGCCAGDRVHQGHNARARDAGLLLELPDSSAHGVLMPAAVDAALRSEAALCCKHGQQE